LPHTPQRPRCRAEGRACTTTTPSSARSTSSTTAPERPHSRANTLSPRTPPEDFRGASRFSTWAYKFALLEAAVKLRRRSWQTRSVLPRAEGRALFFAAPVIPDEDAEHGQVLEAARLALREALTPHQREVLVALALDRVPIDVLAESLGSTRGALYATLHDARCALRARLTASGIAPHQLERIAA
jgi:DNA-directed RNA polymerase specialized sigma24 family protein